MKTIANVPEVNVMLNRLDLSLCWNDITVTSRLTPTKALSLAALLTLHARDQIAQQMVDGQIAGSAQ